MERDITLTERQVQASLLSSDPAWLRLPIAKKKIGLDRLLVMLEFDREEWRSKADAQAAADRIGIKLRSFYALLKVWRDANRSPFALIPFAGDSAGRRSRLPEDVATKLKDLASQLVAAGPTSPMSELVSQLKADWGKVPALPSDVTLRAFIDRAREDHRPAPGSITAATLGFNQQPKSRGFGDVLIVDHTAPADILMKSVRGSVPPTLTIVFDEFTATPVGVAVSKHVPNGDGVVHAVKNACDFITRHIPDADLQGSTIVFATSFDLSWKGLADDLIAKGFRVNEVSENGLVAGDVVRAVLGTRLDDLMLSPTKTLRKIPEKTIDTERKILLGFDGVRRVAEDAVEREFHRRVELSALQLPEAGNDDEDRPMSTRVELQGLSRSDLANVATTSDLTGDILPSASRSSIAANKRVMTRHAQMTATERLSDSGLLQRRLERIAKEIVGGDAASLEILPPNGDQPAWHVVVSVSEPAQRTPVWLDLAREAVRLADTELLLVQVIVDVDGAG